MSHRLPERVSEPKPAFWYGIPHGYLSLDLAPPLERIEALLKEVLTLPEDLRDRAEEVLRFYTGIITTLSAKNVLGCAVGLHPDDAGGVTSSVITVSTVPTSGANAKLVLASMAGTTTVNSDKSMRPLELPCGTGFLAEENRRTTAPGRPSTGSDTPPEGDIWQGTVAVTGAGNSDIIVIQLVTPANDLADDYRNVLLGVAHTLTFTDPSLPQVSDDTPNVEPDSAAGTIRSPFG